MCGIGQLRKDRRSLPVLHRINLEQTIRQIVRVAESQLIDSILLAAAAIASNCRSASRRWRLPPSVRGQHCRMARVLESFELALNVL